VTGQAVVVANMFCGWSRSSCCQCAHLTWTNIVFIFLQNKKDGTMTIFTT